jgi:hypothetical protein
MSDHKPKVTVQLSIDDLLAEATKLVRDKIPDGLPATVEVIACDRLMSNPFASMRRQSFMIDVLIEGREIHVGRSHSTLDAEIKSATKAIEKFLSDREAARVEQERAEFDQANVPDRFESSGIA